MNRRTQGFTLLEILVAIALLGILSAVLVSTLTGSLGLNRQAQRQLDTTSSVQQVLENVRNAWNTTSNYDQACAPGMSIPTGYTVRFVNMNSRGQPLTSTGTVVTGTAAVPDYAVSNAATCPVATTVNGGNVGSSTASAPPPMRRVTVQSGTLPAGSAVGTAPTVGKQDVALTLNVLRPQ